MKTFLLNLILFLTGVFIANSQEKPNLDHYPHILLSNENIKMKVFTPDAENGLYRATRFDWSGIIGSVKYKGHEYFGYWKDNQDPTFHEDLSGPAEGFIEPGPGYNEAKAGEKFIRIGVGILEKPDETRYAMFSTYKILDHGTWSTSHGEDWITFSQTINSDFGYACIYTKTVRLKNDGFLIEHTLENTGEKVIETDQFNHNFFMIDHKQSGPPFKVIFPFDVSTNDDAKGILETEGKELRFIKKVEGKSNVFLNLSGYSHEVSDHQVTVLDEDSGAGVTFSVNKPLYRLAFWTCKTTLCPENFIWISVAPGQTENWTSEYTLFVR